MIGFRCLVGILALVATAGVAGAQQSNMTLPEVSVTAPGATTPPAANPYFGNPRVEEEKWRNIPCDASRVGAGAAGACKSGPGQETMAPGVPTIQQSNCGISHDLVMTTVGPLKIEADALVFDPTYVSGIGHQHRACYVEAPYKNLQVDFAGLNQVTRRGTGWRNFVEGGELTTMEFTVGDEDCLAVQKRGPRWGGGYVWLIHASLCRGDRQAVGAADVAAAFQAIQVRVYDPRGNLRLPPQ